MNIIYSTCVIIKPLMDNRESTTPKKLHKTAIFKIVGGYFKRQTRADMKTVVIASS